MDKFDPYLGRKRAVAKINRVAAGPGSRLVSVTENLQFPNRTAELQYAGLGEQRQGQKNHA